METLNSRPESKLARATLLSAVFTLSVLLITPCGKAEPIECGQTIAGTITSPGQTATYTFTGYAGEVASIGIYGQPGSPQFFHAKVDIYGPGEVLVDSWTNNGRFIYITSSGLYTILVHADDDAHVGEYGLSLFFITGRCGTELLWGEPVTNGTITVQGQSVPYRFSGNAGEIITLSAYGQPGFPQYFDAAAWVSNPTGTQWAGCTNGSITLTLPRTGTYTVFVFAKGLAHMGTYSLSLSFVRLVPASYRLRIGTTNGAADLKLWGEPGRTMTIQCATNLAGTNIWSPVKKFALPCSPYRFVHWDSTNSPQAFYRLVQEP